MFKTIETWYIHMRCTTSYVHKRTNVRKRMNERKRTNVRRHTYVNVRKYVNGCVVCNSQDMSHPHHVTMMCSNAWDHHMLGIPCVVVRDLVNACSREVRHVVVTRRGSTCVHHPPHCTSCAALACDSFTCVRSCRERRGSHGARDALWTCGAQCTLMGGAIVCVWSL